MPTALRDTLKKIEELLQRPGGQAGTQEFVCVSTQLIECGVDISFRRAGRLLAGLDNLLQTAGRCNRNGESQSPQNVYLFRCTDEKLTGLPEIKRAQDAMEALLQEFESCPEKFSGDLFSNEASAFYYRKLFQGMKKEAQDGPIKGSLTLFRLLSQNEHYSEELQSNSHYYFRQAFQLAGERFKVFENDTYDILVPYGEGKELIAELCSGKAEHDFQYFSELLERAKPYTVSVFAYQKNELSSQDALIERSGVLILKEGWYSQELGLQTEQGTLSFEMI